MSENNLIKQPFGLNVALPKRTLQEVQHAAKQEIKDFAVNPFLNYIEKYYSVPPEKITEDLRKAQGQIYALGQAMREGQTSSSLNMKF